MATPLPDQQPAPGEPAIPGSPGGTTADTHDAAETAAHAATTATTGTAAAGPSEAPALDPVRQRREVFRRWVTLAKRLGYLLLLAAIVVFVVAFFVDFNATMASIVIGLFIASCILLAPSIVLGYAVNAADREDRQQGF